MKKILIFAAYFYPHIGGFEKNIGELSRRLIEKGYKVDILTDNSNGSPAEEKLNDINIYRLPCWDILGGTYPIPRPSLTGTKILIKLLRNDYDIVNTQTRFFIISFFGLIFAKIKSIPLVHTERGSRHSAVSNKLVDIFSKTYDHTIGSLLVKSARVNIGISEAAGEFIKHLGAHNIEIIPNGIDINVCQKRSSDWRRKLEIKSDCLVITFVGRLIHGKGVQDLISVFPNIKYTCSTIKLLIVGDGPYKKDLQAQSSQTGFFDDIIFLGQKELNDVIDILSITDIFVNPSYSEGLPTSVMEAASIGLSIIATDVGGTREIVINYKTGILVKAGDIAELNKKLLELINNNNLRQELGVEARLLVKQTYDWSKITERITDIFDNLGKNK